MQIPAKADYAIRALLELAQRDEPTTAEALAQAQQLPSKFLATILNDLRHAGFIASRRGHGGYQLTKPAGQITVADVMRVIDGSLVQIHGQPPELTTYHGAATHLQAVWIAALASLSSVLETVTLDHITNGQLPAPILPLISDPPTCPPLAPLPRP